ncbi:MAG: hypothetical protein HZA50_09050, partial [Planctomycetes bacterium]|nr:hypothetical protein [Planctomycetota bacterium]
EGGAEAVISYRTHFQRFFDNNGLWHVDFWAKIKEGKPKLTIRFIMPGADALVNQPVELTDQWKKYQLTMKVEGVGEPKDAKAGDASPQFVFAAVDGQVLLDDIEAWLDGDKNPTVFRDEVVETLKLFRPGSIRYLQMGGDTLENTIMPPLKAYSHDSQVVAKGGPENRHLKNDYSLHETYQLSEYIGSEPWYCLPGTLSIDEIKAFMEYLGGSADTKYGKLRSDLGHPKPWTETLKRIHVEFGNEAWNNAVGYKCGGFNGQDFWKDLIDAAKASPHYKPNVIFHAGTQAANTGKTEQICGYVPNADRIAIAPYIAGLFDKSDAEAFDTTEKLFYWVFGWALHRSLEKESSMETTYQTTKKAGIEMSIYEINHHITMGDGPEEPRNRITTSLAGGVNVANTMLLMLKRHGVRTQNLFAFIQYAYKSKAGGNVRLWGTALNMRKGRERYRPTFLACAMANKILGGDLVETVHGGANPTFHAAGRFEDKKPHTYDGNCIWSYAFSDGKKRGLILVNLDLKTNLPVELKFQGKPKGTATCWTMAADNPAASNEFENEKPQVEVVESQVELQSGGKLTLPPCSMKALAWEVE